MKNATERLDDLHKMAGVHNSYGSRKVSLVQVLVLIDFLSSLPGSMPEPVIVPSKDGMLSAFFDRNGSRLSATAVPVSIFGVPEAGYTVALKMGQLEESWKKDGTLVGKFLEVVEP